MVGDDGQASQGFTLCACCDTPPAAPGNPARGAARWQMSLYRLTRATSVHGKSHRRTIQVAGAKSRELRTVPAVRAACHRPTPPGEEAIRGHTAGLRRLIYLLSRAGANTLASTVVSIPVFRVVPAVRASVKHLGGDLGYPPA